MIRIKEKERCCGCEACVQSCPKSCIQMKEDALGFLYPVVDERLCVDCGLCERVCPVLHPYAPKQPMQIEAVMSKNDSLRAMSSSGGFFSELAQWVIRQGGVVFGARFAYDWSVEHTYIEKEEDLWHLRGSKYVQSRIGDSYAQVQSFLKANRWVLFSGTSCQVSGLKHFLRNKEYDRLLLVEVVCHGVPNNKMWHSYLNELTDNKIKDISSIRFRDKEHSWKSYHVKIQWGDNNHVESFRKNPYMLSFVRNVSLRPSCYSCSCKSFATGSDFALADFWGVDKLYPTWDDDKGIGLVFVMTERAKRIFSALDIKAVTVSAFDQVIAYNPSIVSSVQKPKRRMLFLGGWLCGIPYIRIAKAFSRGVGEIVKSWVGKSR